MNTYDPYQVVTRPTVGVFSGLPSAAPGTVLVVDREGHPLRALLSHSDRLTAGEARFGRIRTLYRVDVTEHTLGFSQNLPCRDDVGGFQAHVRLVCRVEEPEDVVRRGIHDVSAILVPAITETLRQVCRRYDAEQHAAAEESALAKVREIEAAARHDPSFRVTQIRLELQLDRAAAAFVSQLKADRRTRAIQESQAMLSAQRVEHDARMAKEQDRLDAEREKQAAAIERERLEISRVRQRLEAELEAERLELKAAHDELEIRREHRRLEAKLSADQLMMDHYLAALSQGQYGVLGLRLVEDPSKVEQVAALLVRQRDAETLQRIEALRLLLDSDALEGWEISDQARILLRQLLEIWHRQDADPVRAAVADGVAHTSRDEISGGDGALPAAEPKLDVNTIDGKPAEAAADTTSESHWG